MGEKRLSYLDLMNETVLPFFDRSKKETFIGVGQVSLSYAHFRPAQSHAAAVCFVIVPGRTESFFKYAETIRELTLLGHEVFAFDHRGQGYSQRLLENRQVGYVEDFANYVADLKIFLEKIVVAKKSFARTFLVAHSMGAAVALALWSKFYGADLFLSEALKEQLGFAGLIFSAPMLGIRLNQPNLVVEGVLALRCLMGRGESFVTSNGEFQVDKYGDDLSFCVHRLEWYRKALTERKELQLGLPSNLWMLRALRFCAKLRRHLQRNPLQTSVLIFKPGKDEVVEARFWNLISVVEPDFVLRVQELPESGHDPFIETDTVRKALLGALQLFVQEPKSKL